MKIFDTERLTLHELTEADAGFMLRLLNEPAFIRFIGDRGVRTEAEAQAYLRERLIPSYGRFGFGLWLVKRQTDGAALGICGLIKRDLLEDVDIGFAFLPEFWGQGYAREAATATLKYGRDVVDLRRVVAIVVPENERSLHLLEMLGLQFDRWMTWPDDGTTLNVLAINF